MAMKPGWETEPDSHRVKRAKDAMSNVIDAAEEQVERFPASRYLSVHFVVIIVLD